MYVIFFVFICKIEILSLSFYFVFLNFPSNANGSL